MNSTYEKSTMSLITFFSSHSKVILAITVIILGFVFQEYVFRYSNTVDKFITKERYNGLVIFTDEQLSDYNGFTKDKLYLAFMGTVYDVSKASKHYGKGGSYHYFVGKDGSRALVTGNFKDESFNKDHVLDLPCDKLFMFSHWNDTFKEKYVQVGILIGRYFDENGERTAYTIQFERKIEECKLEKEKAKAEERRLPPCNIEWSVKDGTRVWCTNTSGGIYRKWIGVPRQLYVPGDDNPRCVCVNLENDNSMHLFKEYENCHSLSVSCTVKTDDS